jgi:hypothetical protein
MTFLGNLQNYRVALGARTIIEVEQSGGREWKVGEEVAIEIDPARTYFIAEPTVNPQSAEHALRR